MKIAIIGSGDLGQLIAYHAKQSSGYEIAGYFDDFAQDKKATDGHLILGKIDNIMPLYQKKTFDALMVGIGYKHFDFRKKVYEQFKGIIPFAKVIHPSAYIDPSASIGEGCFILPGCTLDKGVEVGPNVLLNTSCCIAHDSAIGAHSFLAPRVALAGFINIGECCMLGINSTIIDNIVIPPKTVIGGGAVVIKSVETAGLYVGVPAKLVV